MPAGVGAGAVLTVADVVAVVAVLAVGAVVELTAVVVRRVADVVVVELWRGAALRWGADFERVVVAEVAVLVGPLGWVGVVVLLAVVDVVGEEELAPQPPAPRTSTASSAA